jgi:hypothetical protein
MFASGAERNFWITVHKTESIVHAHAVETHLAE